MNPEQAYSQWASLYDSNENKTRDLEAIALRQELGHFTFKHCLEIGCGTGKNTEWLVQKAQQVTAVDITAAMLDKAKEKVKAQNIHFLLANIKESWNFAASAFDLITFSLVLEHIEDLDFIFQQASERLHAGGYIYIGELHPAKQYVGSKARFETESGVQVVECYTHHFSDFLQAAKAFQLQVVDVNEYFDENDRSLLPRVLTILLQKR